MLQMRLITPAERTEDVVALLRRTVGTAHLMVLPGVAQEPVGDVVLCDVAREAADALIGHLRALGLSDDGAIIVDNVDLSLSTRSARAERDAPGEGVDAVLWEAMDEATQGESRLSVTWLAFLVVATMLAASGVMLDSAILLVGAMAVGPEFGPLAGICTSVAMWTPRRAVRPVVALLVGFPLAALLTCAFALLMDVFGLFSKAMFEGPHPASQFVWRPDAMSFVVAALAGIAGILSLTSAKAGMLVGVAISVTTVPAAGHAALALGYGHFADARGSMTQLGLNLLGILIAGTLTLLAQKLYWARKRLVPVATPNA
ncbi:DUF389 domain-containing protein [Streptomyces radicis]|uniref:DUF389 domain-containing protein n=1 Tax=Streptomyces radicis TaxID=1750517 RepID=A0A3A9VV04_9ACTN|nr:DUF389 domain-containing protein [Streptomyces radicis]RKN04352.1 DUF389 domain-containing protein [Streptomyces radicis]RKN14860.1 DUF389 domain-containing protein [Streptomyces radicis]